MSTTTTPAAEPLHQWAHRAADDSPRVGGRRLDRNRWYILTGPRYDPRIVSGPCGTIEQAWQHA
jgi:hypothetical protein